MNPCDTLPTVASLQTHASLQFGASIRLTLAGGSYNVGMSEARSYSVTPCTLCIRHQDGTKEVLQFTRPKDASGCWGYLKGGSFKSPGGAWTRAYEHPQEWSDDV